MAHSSDSVREWRAACHVHKPNASDVLMQCVTVHSRHMPTKAAFPSSLGLAALAGDRMPSIQLPLAASHCCNASPVLDSVRLMASSRSRFSSIWSAGQQAVAHESGVQESQ